MRPFGHALQYSLENARINDNENADYALWIEEDYCSPPLAMERESVLDQYFNDIDTDLLDKLPEEMRTMIMAYTNVLDEKISSLLISDEDFENRYMQTIMDLVIV